MEAVEFQTKIKNGVIEIPKAYQATLSEGIEVKVVVLKPQRHEHIEALKTLFKETQALPQAQTITEEEIVAEIDAYRSGR
ncbi:hypothetical protein [Egbenema bharatensis]|uniref:hypothetical protein n=1 Tax=Egbenema bharatensis TaxID=3463334 RepID=UPI003A8C6717